MESKPREWWIHDPQDKKYCEQYMSTKDPKTLSEADDFMYLKDTTCVHVIEMSAYQAIERKCEILLEALNKIAITGSGDLAYTADFTEIVNSKAREALAKVEGDK